MINLFKGVVIMNDKKIVYLKVQVDTITEQAFRKIIEVKGLSIQNVLEGLLKDYIFENLDCVMTK